MLLKRGSAVAHGLLPLVAHCDTPRVIRKVVATRR
jgi:hypothetical protein